MVYEQQRDLDPATIRWPAPTNLTVPNQDSSSVGFLAKFMAFIGAVVLLGVIGVAEGVASPGPVGHHQHSTLQVDEASHDKSDDAEHSSSRRESGQSFQRTGHGPHGDQGHHGNSNGNGSSYLACCAAACHAFSALPGAPGGALRALRPILNAPEQEALARLSFSLIERPPRIVSAI